MFLTFENQDERRKYGGSAFIELQYCRLAPKTDIKNIVSIDTVKNWNDDSLYIYIDDDNDFVRRYGEIFTGGTYNNLKTGYMDICGINYYSPQLLAEIIKVVKKETPTDYEILLPWLKEAEKYNGVYILGL